jgi:hypothetical protein
MGVYNKYGTIAVGAYMAHQPGSHPRAFNDQYFPRWDRGNSRGPRTWRDREKWVSLWPTSRFAGGGDVGGQGYMPVGQGLGDSGAYEPFSCDGAGTQTKRFLRGLCVDASEVPVANATVQAFRTSDDFYAGEGVSLDDGTYYVGVQQAAATQHYLVAYKAGSPDIAGTTVNTLTPTNVDGS